jgi:RND family efflux transporter MFP subunit
MKEDLMNNSVSPLRMTNFTRPARISLALLALALSGLMLAVISCKPSGGGAKPADVDYYTCTMHPSVRSQDPKAKCPICSMDLVPVKKKNGQTNQPPVGEPRHDHAKTNPEQPIGKGQPQPGHAGHAGHAPGARTTPAATSDETPSEFSIPLNRLQQIGVTYTTVEKKPLRHSIRAVGTVAYDKQRHWDYVARVEGYVQKLEVASRGELVEKDQPLLTIYSPELLTAQREFVDLLRMRDDAKKSGTTATFESAERLIESAKRKLSLWNITDQQIMLLKQTREAKETLTLHSPFRGVVQDIPVDQGRRVMVGDHLVDVADLSVVWVWADFYQDELPMLKKGLSVTVTTSSYPGDRFNGKIVVVDPFINDARRTGRIRIDVENADLKLRPDMFVDAELAMDMGEALTLPVNAVMPTGKRNVVFVDKGEGKLEPRLVELGRKFGDDYEVRSGVKEGERVVASANFLIDAEAKVQGALKSW